MEKTYNNVYGYVNGKPTYSHDEYVFALRRFGAIENDADLLTFAEKVTFGWYDAGWKRTFTSFYLSDYALAEPRHSLTDKEFTRLLELQAEAKAEAERVEAAKQWQKIDTIYWADNSVEEIYEGKDGTRKAVMVVGPHGDAC